MPIAIDWPADIYHDLERGYSLRFGGDEPIPFYFVGIELVDPDLQGDLVFRIFTEEASTVLRLELFGEGDASDYRVVHVSGDSVFFQTSRAANSAERFLGRHPPLIWFVDGSCLAGNQHVSPKAKHEPYDRAKIIVWDWAGIDLTKESQGLTRKADSIHVYAVYS